MKEKFVQNGVNLTNIEYIKIYGLFDRYDVEMPFRKIANIYIGENGMGKTTVLNCIYFLLDKKFARLAEINFKSIEIKFKKELQPHTISVYDLNKYNQRGIPRDIRYIDNELIEHMLEDMLEVYDDNAFFHNKVYMEDQIELVSRRISRMLNIPATVARRSVYEYISTKRFVLDNKKGDSDKVKRLINSINKNINQKILYLPTYRRIEDDYSKLNISAEKGRESDILIRFGMSDVLNSKNRILENIRHQAIDGFNKMAGVLLKQYANSTDKINMVGRKNSAVDIKTVKLILDRIGDEIDDNSKNEIIDLISSNKIYNEKYKLLMDLLDKLIISYESQKEYDDRIKLFADTCNKYLNGKKFYYNPSELTLEIYIECNGELTSEIVELPQLSSGEKQIVSLFSKLYLENAKEAIVIIDEPELSLSIKWQSMLLPDIIRSGNCKLLLTVTHSPFIFENEFDLDACEMRKCIRYTHGG